MREVFITGGTGYVGRPLIEVLARRGWRITALARAASVERVPKTPGVAAVTGDALDAASYAHLIPPRSTFVHLIGTPHPSPAKAADFMRVDLASIRAAIVAARQADVAHFVYVSVAQPAPVMQAYLAVRAEGERMIAAQGLAATILRPWYVLGPGHWWPLLLMPVYAIAQRLPATRPAARRLGLVTLRQMVAALVMAVEVGPASGTRIVDVPAIRGAQIK
jgi:uncharacterized protein YbjT (DUF2867 family)